MGTVVVIRSSDGWGGYIPFSGDYKPPKPAEYTSRGRAPSCGDGPFYRVRSKPHLVVSQTGADLPAQHVTGQNGSGIGATRWVADVSQYDWGFSVTINSERYSLGRWRDNGGRRYDYRRTLVAGNILNYDYIINYRPAYSSAWYYDYTTGMTGEMVDLKDISEVPAARPLYDEFIAAYEAGYINPIRHQYWAQCFMDAASALPEADVNLIGNIKEAFDYVKGAIQFLKSPASSMGELFQSFADPKDLWLKYRYVYKTNQMDAKEINNLVSRLDYLSACSESELTTQAWTDVGSVRYGATMRFPISSVLPNDVYSLIKQFGLQVKPSNVWDLIPFSFMVDWFADIGNKLSFLEDWAGAVELKPMNLWFILRANDVDGVDVYMRIPGQVPVVPPMYMQKSASGKVVTMRVADTISIFT